MFAKLIVLICTLIMFDNACYMFGILSATYVSDKSKSLEPLVGYVLAAAIIYYLLSPAVVSIKVYYKAMFCQGVLELILALPVKINSTKFYQNLSAFSVFLLTLFNLTLHPSFNVLTSNMDNLNKAISKSLSYSIFSNPLINIEGFWPNIICTSLLYLVLITVVPGIVNNQKNTNIKIYNNVSLVLILDGLLKVLYGGRLIP